MRNTADVTGGKPIAVLLQSISGVSAINPLVAFYDIHGGKREVLFFYFVPDTTRELKYYCLNMCLMSQMCSETDVCFTHLRLALNFLVICCFLHFQNWSPVENYSYY
jgi:hypothetical protein